VQVGGIEIEEPPPRPASLVGLVEVVLVDLGRLLEQLSAQRQVVRVRGEERLLPRQREIPDAPEQRRQPLDVVADALVRGIDAQRLAPRGQRQLARAQLLLL
jgi:hypothetical protein